MESWRAWHIAQKCIGDVDGGRLSCADYVNPDVQNAFSGGWNSSEEKRNVFVFDFTRESIHVELYICLDSWHEIKLTAISGLLVLHLPEKTTPRKLFWVTAHLLFKECTWRVNCFVPERLESTLYSQIQR